MAPRPMNHTGDDTDSRRALAALGLILAAAALLRFFRLDFDLPEVVFVDSFKFVDEAARMAREGTLRPREFQYPGLYSGVLACIYGVFGPEPAYFRYLAGRAVSAAAGVGLVGAVWYAASRAGGLRARVIAASLACLSISGLTYSRLCAADSLLLLFMTLALGALASRSRATRTYAAAGGLIGLAAGTKYTGGMLAPFLVLTAAAAYLRHRDKRVLHGGILAGAGAAALAFLLVTPYFVPLFGKYLARLSAELTQQSVGAMGGIQLGCVDYILSRSMAADTPWLGFSILENLGPVILVAGLGAVVLALSGRYGFAPLLYALFVVLYLAVITGPGRVKSPRYLLPALPPLFILIGWASERLLMRMGPRGFTAGLYLAAILLAVPAAKSAKYAARLFRPSTNAEARAWAARSIPPGSTVFVEPFYTNDLLELPARFVSLRDIGSRSHRWPLGRGLNPEENPVYYPELMSELEAAGADYLVFNSGHGRTFSALPENLRWFPKSIRLHDEFMRRVRRRCELVYSIRADHAGRFGPDIDVYRLRGLDGRQETVRSARRIGRRQ